MDELNLDFYRANNRDLLLLDDNELICHYEQLGRAEGRPCNPAAFRENFITLLGQCTNILEIGPFCNPSIIGSNVKYFDVLSTVELQARAVSLGLPSEGVPAIHYVSPTGDLSSITESFHSVISSHVVEHQPCLVSHLQQVSRLLLPGSPYFLIVPDKRFCFDHYIAESTVADVLCAFYEKRTTHGLNSVLEHVALTTHNDSLRHWRGDHGESTLTGDSTSICRIREALDVFYNPQGSYVDVHAWQFTPSSFRSIMLSLYSLSVTDLYPLLVFDTPYGRQEFTAILVKK